MLMTMASSIAMVSDSLSCVRWCSALRTGGTTRLSHTVGATCCNSHHTIAVAHSAATLQVASVTKPRHVPRTSDALRCMEPPTEMLT